MSQFSLEVIISSSRFHRHSVTATQITVRVKPVIYIYRVRGEV